MFNFFKFFRKPKPAESSYVTRKLWSDIKREALDEKLTTEYIGKRVITCSTESFSVGTCCGLMHITQARDTVPLVLHDGHDTEHIVLGAMCLYHEGLYEFLKTIGSHEAYDIVSGISWEKLKFSGSF